VRSGGGNPQVNTSEQRARRDFHLASIVIIGLALGWARQRSGGLAAPLFIHTAFNGASLLLRALLS
jgi:CAAX prenyl protease-like protein